MNHNLKLQAVLEYIDDHIFDAMSLADISDVAGYSIYHFSRIFKEIVGISLKNYMTWRKLQFALNDLCRGKKVSDVAMRYGFQTHAGFTKAFVRWFGFPPSLCHKHLHAGPPAKANIQAVRSKFTLTGEAVYHELLDQ